MNLQSVSQAPKRVFNKPVQDSGEEVAERIDDFHYRGSSYGSRKLLTTTLTLGGAAAGAFTLAHLTGDFTGTSAQIMGGIGGATTGMIGLGLVGMGIGGQSSGFEGLAGGIAGALVGGAIGAALGGYGGAMLGVGAGNVLSYVTGALGGSILGGLVAKGLNS